MGGARRARPTEGVALTFTAVEGGHSSVNTLTQSGGVGGGGTLAWTVSGGNAHEMGAGLSAHEMGAGLSAHTAHSPASVGHAAQMECEVFTLTVCVWELEQRSSGGG